MPSPRFLLNLIKKAKPVGKGLKPKIAIPYREMLEGKTKSFPSISPTLSEKTTYEGIQQNVAGKPNLHLYTDKLTGSTFGVPTTENITEGIVKRLQRLERAFSFKDPELLERIKDISPSLQKFATTEDKAWQLTNFGGMKLIKRNVASVESEKLYRPAVRMKDGTILWHPEARLHSDAIAMQPTVKKFKVFDYDAVKGSGGIGPDGHYYESKMLGDAFEGLAEEGIVNRLQKLEKSFAPKKENFNGTSSTHSTSRSGKPSNRRNAHQAA